MSRSPIVKHRVELAVARATLALAGASPPAVTRFVVSGGLRVFGARRIVGASMRQLELAFGPDLDEGGRRAVVRAMIGNLGRVAWEIARFFREGRPLARALVEPDATRERLERLRTSGRGFVVVTPHFGNWEILPAWFLAEGFQGVVVANRLHNPLLNDWIERARDRAGVRVVYQDESARRLLRTLEEGGVVGILPDQDLDRLPGVFVDFFGRPAYTSTGAAALARAAGVPILASFLEWDGSRYRLGFEEPIEVPRSDDRERDLRECTEAWSRRFEARIRARPEHWVWFHRRWRTTEERLRRRGRIRARGDVSESAAG